MVTDTTQADGRHRARRATETESERHFGRETAPCACVLGYGRSTSGGVNTVVAKWRALHSSQRANGCSFLVATACVGEYAEQICTRARRRTRRIWQAHRPDVQQLEAKCATTVAEQAAPRYSTCESLPIAAGARARHIIASVQIIDVQVALLS